MQGVTLIETETLQALMAKVESINNFISNHSANDNHYLSSQEAADMMGFSEVWICNNKQHIGYISIGRNIRFKRKDIDAYMEANYFKTKSQRRKYS